MLASDRNVIKQVYLAMNLELFNAGHGRVARLRYQAFLPTDPAKLPPTACATSLLPTIIQRA